jgi:hypothetical protein
MNRKLILVIVSIILIIGYLFFYNDEDPLYKKLKQEIETGKVEIKLADLTDFEWDKVCVYEPYSWHNEENLWSLVFEKDSKVIYEIDIPRALTGDLEISNCIGNKEAKLVLSPKIVNNRTEYHISLIDK